MSTLNQTMSTSDHVEGLAQKLFGDHPVLTAVLMGVLVLILIIMTFYVMKYKTLADKAPAAKASFTGGLLGPMGSAGAGPGGPSPQWALGGQGAGEPPSFTSSTYYKDAVNSNDAFATSGVYGTGSCTTSCPLSCPASLNVEAVEEAIALSAFGGNDTYFQSINAESMPMSMTGAQVGDFIGDGLGINYLTPGPGSASSM